MPIIPLIFTNNGWNKEVTRGFSGIWIETTQINDHLQGAAHNDNNNSISEPSSSSVDIIAI